MKVEARVGDRGRATVVESRCDKRKLKMIKVYYTLI